MDKLGGLSLFISPAFATKMTMLLAKATAFVAFLRHEDHTLEVANYDKPWP